MVNKIYLLLFVFFSSSASAVLEIDENRKKILTESATSLHKEASSLPEVHFLNEQ